MIDNRSHGHYCIYCLTTFAGELEECPNHDCEQERPHQGWGGLLGPGDEIDNRFQVHRKLHLGPLGVSYLCQEQLGEGSTDGPLLAIQVISSLPDSLQYTEKLDREIDTLQTIDHPGIVRIHELVQRDDHPAYLVTEFTGSGSLLDHLRQHGALSLVQVGQLGLQICDAMLYAHNAGVIHGDLRPENILLSKGDEVGVAPSANITDFGTTQVMGSAIRGRQARSRKITLSPQYAAPERFQGAPPTAASDTYSVGAVLLFCQSLHPLLQVSQDIDPEVLAQKLEAELPPRWSTAHFKGNENATRIAFFNAFLAACMDPSPEERLSLEEVRKYLEAMLEADEDSAFLVPDWATDEEVVEGDPEEEGQMVLQHFHPFLAQQEEEEEEDEPEEEEPAATEKESDEAAEAEEEGVVLAALPLYLRLDWRKIAKNTAKWGLIGSGVAGGLGLIVGTWIWFKEPQMLPPSVLDGRGSPALDLIAGNPSTQPDYDRLRVSLEENKSALSACDLAPLDTLRLELIVEPSGTVRSVKTSYLPRKTTWCVRQKLLNMKLSRQGNEPAHLVTTLYFDS